MLVFALLSLVIVIVVDSWPGDIEGLIVHLLKASPRGVSLCLRRLGWREVRCNAVTGCVLSSPSSEHDSSVDE